MRVARLTALIIVTLLSLTGCDARYYWQAAAGQLDLIQRREPIDTLIAADTTPDPLKQRLQYILEVRRFAAETLQLETGNHYLAYADLERPYVVWNVFATPDLSLENERWCFPIAGCVPYRGYFAEDDARAFADTLAAKGMDTYVGGVPAYSTLGWFDDAVLNTFIHRNPIALAGLIFHELAHQTLYLPGDSTFNESFATAIENIGIEYWITAAQLDHLLPDYQTAKQRHREFLALVLDHRTALQTLYDSDQTRADKLAGKDKLTQQLLLDYQKLKTQWNGYDGYDRWFAGPLNNAQLSTIATYHQLEPGFRALFQQSNNDFSRFYQRCRDLGELDQSERHSFLKRLASGDFVYTDR